MKYQNSDCLHSKSVEECISENTHGTLATNTKSPVISQTSLTDNQSLDLRPQQQERSGGSNFQILTIFRQLNKQSKKQASLIFWIVTIYIIVGNPLSLDIRGQASLQLNQRENITTPK
jgi:hypothetical protein